MEDLLRVGVISSAHGIKGEVNVFPTTDEPEMFAHWKTLRLVEKKQSRLIHVRGAKYFKNMVILSLEEIADRNQAELLRQAELYEKRQEAAGYPDNTDYSKMPEYNAVMIRIITVIAAVILDWIFGDPYSFPHPIRYIGSLISVLDKKIRLSCDGNAKKERKGGVFGKGRSRRLPGRRA